MSILIRGMEMPKNCSDCPLNHNQMACRVTGTRWWSDTMVLMDFDSDKERLYDCPLVELPEKHGWLIDADAVNKAMDERIEKLKDDKSIYEASCVATALDMFAPTVIEAEGETE